MKIEGVATIPVGLRRAYLASLLEPQELFVESIVAAGRVFVFRDADEVVGHAVVGEGAIVEFFVVDRYLTELTAMFDMVLTTSGTTRALGKTFDPIMMAAASSRPATTRTTGLLFRVILDRGFVPDPNLRTRMCTTMDIEAVWSINDGFFDDRDELGRYAAEGRSWLYETAAGDLVGCGICTRTIAGLDAVDIGMVVAERHRRRGIGTYIAADLKQRCLEAGDRPVCGCSADNVGSRRALENAGFAAAHSLVEFVY